MLKVLGIESSCDDTGVAIITDAPLKIAANEIISQNEKHQRFQGVVPEIAARSHLDNIERTLFAALEQAQITLKDIDIIAATTGPGLIGSLLIGSVFANSLAHFLAKPFIAINHLEGHALTARLTNQVSYPYLLLLLSGGHCQFVSVFALGHYKILGKTLDDALGEAFDKVAKMLGLPFPGGPEIEKAARYGNKLQYELPKPLIHSNDCNFSFSGLKTAVRLLIKKLQDGNSTNIDTNDVGLTLQQIYDIAASFQYTVFGVVKAKIIKAIKDYESLLSVNDLSNQNFKKLVVAGGVAANQALKKELENSVQNLGYKIIIPPPKLCTDNAAMIAYVGLERFKSGFINGDFCPRARWSLEELSIK